MTRPAAVTILALLAAGMYVLSPSAPVSSGEIRDANSLVVDGVIEAVGVQSLTWHGVKRCLTPDDKFYCWETKPEVTIQ